jgi:hypothetical protein
MNYQDLKNFKETVHDKRMQQILDKTEIKDGQVFIDNINIRYSDGRSYGFDILYLISGSVYIDGNVEEFEEEYADISVEEFLAILEDKIVIGYGDFTVTNDEKPLTITTKIEFAVDCSPMFEDLSKFESLKYEKESLQYEKLSFL